MTNDTNWSLILRTYEREYRDRCQAELDSFADERTFEAAVSRAARAVRPDGKRYAHQRRIPGHVLAAADASLRKARLKRCSTFHELFVAVRESIGCLPGIGELMVYDTALRVGAWLRLGPEKVYLHSGTRQGARVLGLDCRAEAIERRELPRELQLLRPCEVEDVLCIFKDWFGTARSFDRQRDVRTCDSTRRRRRKGC